jgi:pimeloyl-ACP methyl ester carboxylesterase
MNRFNGLILACFLAATFVYAGPAAGFSESEDAAFLENSFMEVLQNEYGINGSSLLGHDTLSAITDLPAFQTWRSQLLADLDAASDMASTAMGEIQYRREGSGPIMLIFHGGMTGFDGNYLLSGLVEQGFQLIGFSRPGYLRTPLGQSPNFAEEADMAAALLDYLGVSDPVIVYATSLGGPSALYFALNHPQRTQALLMQSAVSQIYGPSETAAGSFLGRFFFGDYALDERSWILLEMAKRWPERLFFEYLYITNHYCDDKNWELAQKCMADATQRERFILLLTIMSPLSQRMPGTFSEDEYAAVLPNLPLGNIKAPALITQDLMDADVEFRHAQYMINTIPNAQLYSFRGAGHFYMFGDTWPGTFNRAVEFLKSVSPR